MHCLYNKYEEKIVFPNTTSVIMIRGDSTEVPVLVLFAGLTESQERVHIETQRSQRGGRE